MHNLHMLLLVLLKCNQTFMTLLYATAYFLLHIYLM